MKGKLLKEELMDFIFKSFQDFAESMVLHEALLDSSKLFGKFFDIAKERQQRSFVYLKLSNILGIRKKGSNFFIRFLPILILFKKFVFIEIYCIFQALRVDWFFPIFPIISNILGKQRKDTRKSKKIGKPKNLSILEFR